MSIDTLQKTLNEIDYPVMLEIVDNIWYLHADEIHWNEEDNKDDLEKGEMYTYSIESREGSREYDGYLVVNGDNGCGETITYFFNLSKEVKF